MNFFNFAPEPDHRPVNVITRRAMLLHRHGERLPRHAESGEHATVEQWVLDMLPRDFFEAVGLAAPAISDHSAP